MTIREALEKNRGKQLLIGGHRGHLSDVRENTIENYEQLQGENLFHIELDVQLTKDDVPVIYHDFDLAMRSPLKGRIRDYTAEELKAAFRIDTLEETIRWCREHGQQVAFELKSRALDMYDYMELTAKKVADAISEQNFSERCFVFSTDYRSLSLIYRRNPKILQGLIVPIIPAEPAALLREMHAQIYLCYVDNLHPEIVRQVHEAGYYVDGSVVNTPERLKTAMSLGVDLIESDDPISIKKQYKEWNT